MQAAAAVPGSAELQRLTQDVKEMVIERLQLEAEPEDIEDQELLFGGNLDLDSITMLELVAGLEERYGIEVEDEDITPELLESARSLAQYVMAKLGQANAAEGQRA